MKYQIVPRVIMSVLLAVQLLRDANRHGKTRETTENFWITLAAVVFNVGLFYWGGFYS